MKILFIVLGAVFAIVVIAWLGLRIKPAPFESLSQAAGVIETIPLPEGLPAPVERYYRQLFGEQIPVITSAVISGRATMQPNMSFPAFPARFRFTHDAGQAYRHYMEMTIFGIPVVIGNEHFLEGKGRMDISIIGVDEGAHIDQAANLALWAESLWLPSVWITDPRVRWEPVDDDTAILVVPFDEQEQHMLIRFDPETGMLKFLEAMRYRDTGDTKMLWIDEASGWENLGGYSLPAVGAVTWFDQKKPWAVFTVEEIVYNIDVKEYVRQTGP